MIVFPSSRTTGNLSLVDQFSSFSLGIILLWLWELFQLPNLSPIIVWWFIGKILFFRDIWMDLTTKVSGKQRNRYPSPVGFWNDEIHQHSFWFTIIPSPIQKPLRQQRQLATSTRRDEQSLQSSPENDSSLVRLPVCPCGWNKKSPACNCLGYQPSGRSIHRGNVVSYRCFILFLPSPLPSPPPQTPSLA